MHLNTDPCGPPRKPCIRDLAQLTATLLPENLVKLVPLDELHRRAQEINQTHPQYREETPLVERWEQQRRQYLAQGLRLASSHSRVA